MSKKSIVVLLVLILILGLGVGGYFIFKDDDSDDGSNKNEITSDNSSDTSDDQNTESDIEPLHPDFLKFNFIVPDGWEIIKKEYAVNSKTGVNTFLVIVSKIGTNVSLNYYISDVDAEKEPFCLNAGDETFAFATSQEDDVFDTITSLDNGWVRPRILDDGAIDYFLYTKSLLNSQDEGYQSILEDYNAGTPMEVRTEKSHCGYKVKIGGIYNFADQVEDSQGNLRFIYSYLFRTGDISYIKGKTVNFIDENTVKEADEIIESTTGVIR